MALFEKMFSFLFFEYFFFPLMYDFFQMKFNGLGRKIKVMPILTVSKFFVSAVGL